MANEDFSSVIGQEKAKQALKDAFIYPHKHPDLLK